MSLTLQKIESLLSQRIDKELSLQDLPHPNTLYGVNKATQRIADAIKRGEKIALVGDYDVDGVVATAIVAEFFEAIGYPLTVIIPNRFNDGYGISEALILQLHDHDLIITVDNGIGANDAADRARELGIDLIITDHHNPPETLPQAFAIINPKQKACNFTYRDICGAQVAWYLVAALRRKIDAKVQIAHFLDLLSIAIIADMMPLLHINRALVKRGLAHLNRSMRPCIIAFKELYKKEHIDTSTIAFLLAPLINSAGRIDDASKALKFLRAQTIPEAKTHLLELTALNNERKEIERRITQEAIQKADVTKPVIVVEAEGWHEGVAGIVAAKLSRRFDKSAIVLIHKDEKILKGSGRSNGNEDLFGLIKEATAHLLGFGGHQAAVGLSLHKESLRSFEEALCSASKSERYALEQSDDEILGSLTFELIDGALIELLERFSPYGIAHPLPLFQTKGVKVIEAKTMGKEGEHYRLILDDGTKRVEAVLFQANDRFTSGDAVDVIYSIGLNRYRGQARIQLGIEKIKAVSP